MQINTMKEKPIFFLNVLCSIISGINITLLFVLSVIVSNQEITDAIPLLILSLSSPALNIFKDHKKYIYSKIYLILYFIFHFCILIHFINSILFYIQMNQQVSDFELHNYFWKPMVYIIILLLIINVIGYFVKSFILKWKKHDTFFLLEIIVMNYYSLFFFKAHSTVDFLLKIVVTVAIIPVLIPDVFQTKKDKQTYILLIVLSIISQNPLLFIIACSYLKEFKTRN